MANALNSCPMIIDTDITTWRNASAVAAAGYTTGVCVKKLVLAVGTTGTSTAGSVSITAPSDSVSLVNPMVVIGGQAAYTVLYADEPTDTLGTFAWRDFAVTGLTATNTRLFLWWSQ